MTETICRCDVETVASNPRIRPSAVAQRVWKVKVAENEREVAAALALRARVFSACGHLDPRMQIDRDEYDSDSEHLIVFDEISGDVAGTYRIRQGNTSSGGPGFYSEREFRISGLRKIATTAAEAGRSCVDPQFRSGSVAALLWRGIAGLRRMMRFRYLLGCVSLEFEEETFAWAYYESLRRRNRLSKVLKASARSAFRSTPPPVEKMLEHWQEPEKMERKLPPLLKGYLRLGAEICSPPALDRDFRSVDFLILLDFERLSERYRRHFAVEKEEKVDD